MKRRQYRQAVLAGSGLLAGCGGGDCSNAGGATCRALGAATKEEFIGSVILSGTYERN